MVKYVKGGGDSTIIRDAMYVCGDIIVFGVVIARYDAVVSSAVSGNFSLLHRAQLSTSVRFVTISMKTALHCSCCVLGNKTHHIY
jgi:hypothetical protein